MVDSKPSTSPALSLLFRPAAISVLTCVIALIIVVSVTTSSLQRLTESDRSQRHSHEVIAQSEAILESLTDTQRGMRGYILSGRPEALAVYDGAVTRLPLQLSTLTTLEQDADSQTSHLQSLRRSVLDVIGYSRRLLAEYRSFGVQGAVSLESSGLGLEVMNRARRELQALLDEETRQFDARSRNIERYSSKVQLLVSIGAALVLAVLAGAALMAWRQMVERRRAEAAAGVRLNAQQVAEADLEKNRQLLERTVRLSEERFRLVVDGIKDYALFMLSPDGNVLSWNTGAQRLKGYTAAEILGHHFSCFYTPEDQACGHAQDELRIAAADGRYEEEGWRVRKDGSRFLANVVITAVRDSDNTLRGFAKATRDVTEARSLDRANREQAGILDLANDTIFVRDLDGRIIYWNRGAERLYGWNKQEAVGQITHTLLKTRFPKPLEDMMSDLLHDGQWQGELQHTRRDGAQLTVASRWTLQPAGVDAPQRIIEMNHDITLRKWNRLCNCRIRSCSGPRTPRTSFWPKCRMNCARP
jgi:PAS domain S-box-containing protein